MAYFELTIEENIVFNSIDEEFKRLEKHINFCYNGNALIMLDTNKLRKPLNVAKDYPFVAYIKFADRWHNLHTCQKSLTKAF